MVFTNREEAGRQLAKQLTSYANLENVIVLGLPRGGVPVAFEIARALHVPLDIFLSQKLGVPGHEELAFGAVAAGDGRFLDEEIIEVAGISPEQIERITRAAREKLAKRALLYRGGRPPLKVEGRTVILGDDGIATGASIYAAIRALRQMNPAKLVVAVPLAPALTCEWLQSETDQLVVLNMPKSFHAVGQFYEDFSQVSDEEVIALLKRAEQAATPEVVKQDCPEADPAPDSKWDIDQHEMSVTAGNAKLEGTLTLPRNPKGIILFVHGSGSSRYSPRNQYVAEVLQSKGLGTLLFDLLTSEEEAVDRRTFALRFDIALLSKRLIGATKWAAQNPATKNLAIGYFGASTGAAAALVAAAHLPALVAAVVSRGGRPDLAAEALRSVQAPTLLMVGGLDETVITLNRQALDRLHCRTKQLVIVPGATHLFEEPGTLEEMARVAAEWLIQYVGEASEKKEPNVVGLAEAR